MTAQLFVFLSYFLGTLLGLYMGFKHGRIWGEDNTIRCLVEYKFLKHKIVDGQVHILPLSMDDGKD
jgi:hypothetical protein